MLIQRIIWGTLLIVLGVVTLKYNYQIVNFTGRQDWIERYLGSGTTYFAFKLISIIVVLSGILYLTGFGEPVLRYLLSPLSNLLNPVQ